MQQSIDGEVHFQGRKTKRNKSNVILGGTFPMAELNLSVIYLCHLKGIKLDFHPCEYSNESICNGPSTMQWFSNLVNCVHSFRISAISPNFTPPHSRMFGLPTKLCKVPPRSRRLKLESPMPPQAIIFFTFSLIPLL